MNRARARAAVPRRGFLAAAAASLAAAFCGWRGRGRWRVRRLDDARVRRVAGWAG